MIYIGCHLSVTNGCEAMGKTMLELLLLQYKEIFGADFPLAEFDGRQELEVINILYDCVSKCLPYDPERKIDYRITEAPGLKK